MAKLPHQSIWQRLLAACGRRVLLVDFDPQGNASTGLGIDLSERVANSYRLVTGEVSVWDTIKSSFVPGLDIIAAVVELSAAEVELTAVDRREFRLSEALGVSLKSTTIF